ncbi:OadG family protein [Marinimicrobium alkaliphilum]|uniref:OadG family protein n=1 Tax=Marinimicrobium alkaliphilum TaxID=2202654 RepID=UPI000DB9CA13|nr:OadG family protein [Marinimicrobium alkaliphilum]
MQEDVMEQGLDLMLYGMGTVLTFLTLLVVATLVMSFIVRRFFAEPEPAMPKERAGQSQSAPAAAVDDKTLAIIKAAIAQHRDKQK